MKKSESIFENENYYYQMGKVAGKQSQKPVEDKAEAIKQGEYEFDRRRLTMHRQAFVDGYVSSVRGGYFEFEDD